MTSSPNVCPNDIGNEPISVIILSTVYMFLDLQTHGRGPDSTYFYEQTAKRSLNNLLYWLLCFYLLWVLDLIIHPKTLVCVRARYICEV